MFKQVTIGNIAAFLLIYSMYGFPLQSAIPFILQINSNPINIGIRVSLLLISLFLIVFSAFRRIEKLNIGFVWMMVFWLLYTIRLIYDLEIKGVHFVEESKFYVYSFAFGACLIPAMAIYLNGKHLNLKTCIKFTFWLLLLSNLSLVYTLLSYHEWSLVQVFLTRASVLIEVDGEKISIVNGITISYYGQLLALVSIFFIKLKIFEGRLAQFFLSAVCFLGILNLVMGASRGPLLTFISLLIITYLYTFSQIKFNLVKSIKGFLLVILVLGTVATIFFRNFALEDIQFFSRLQNSYDEHVISNVKEERDYQWESAIAQFVKSPVWGDKFVNDFDNSYAHNSILDVLMSLGLLGFFSYIMIYVYLIPKFRYAIHGLKENPSFFFFCILFLAENLAGLTSGGTFAAINFWLLMALLLSYPTLLVARLANN